MKKIIILLAAAAVAVGCSKKTESLEPDPPTPPVPPGLSISFERTDDITVWPGQSIDVAYTLIGADDGTRFECSAENGWTAEIHTTSASSGFLRATAPETAADGDIAVLVSNDGANFFRQTLHFVGGFFEIEEDLYRIEADQQELTVAVTTNMPYEVIIPDDAAWIERINDPTTEAGTLKFSIAGNPDFVTRRAKIEFKSTGGVIRTLTILQRPVPSDDMLRFADRTLETYFVERYDRDNDGVLSYQEVAAITSLESDIPRTIVSFDEFRYFEGVTSISGSTFKNCSELKSIQLPMSVGTIGASAFFGCSSLTSIVLPDGIQTISSFAFAHCSSLTDIVLPAGLQTIGSSAFYDCSSLTDFVFPAGLQTIERNAFRECSSLTNIVLPDGIQKIGLFAFYDCSSLTSVVLPAGLKVINPETFWDCISLTNVVLPAGLQRLGDSVFYGCSALTSIVLPDGLQTIDTNTFYGCSSLTNVVLPAGLQTIDWFAFRYCSSLTSIVLPAGLKTINGTAFSGCTRLNKITFLSSAPPAVNSTFDLQSDIEIYVPAASIEAYKAKEGFSDYADRIFPIEE